MGTIKCIFDQIVIINIKRRDGYQTNFYTNIHLKDDLGIELIASSNEIMQ